MLSTPPGWGHGGPMPGQETLPKYISWRLENGSAGHHVLARLAHLAGDKRLSV